VQPGEKLRERKEELIGMANQRCNELIEQSKLGLIENQPGCDEEQTLEVINLFLVQNYQTIYILNF
jgi:DNA-directed RNA polymerase III subunit RPC1